MGGLAAGKRRSQDVPVVLAAAAKRQRIVQPGHPSPGEEQQQAGQRSLVAAQQQQQQQGGHGHQQASEMMDPAQAQYTEQQQVQQPRTEEVLGLEPSVQPVHSSPRQPAPAAAATGGPLQYTGPAAAGMDCAAPAPTAGPDSAAEQQPSGGSSGDLEAAVGHAAGEDVFHPSPAVAASGEVQQQGLCPCSSQGEEAPVQGAGSSQGLSDSQLLLEEPLCRPAVAGAAPLAQHMMQQVMAQLQDLLQQPALKCMLPASKPSSNPLPAASAGGSRAPAVAAAAGAGDAEISCRDPEGWKEFTMSSLLARDLQLEEAHPLLLPLPLLDNTAQALEQQQDVMQRLLVACCCHKRPTAHLELYLDWSLLQAPPATIHKQQPLGLPAAAAASAAEASLAAVGGGIAAWAGGHPVLQKQLSVCHPAMATSAVSGYRQAWQAASRLLHGLLYSPAPTQQLWDAADVEVRLPAVPAGPLPDAADMAVAAELSTGMPPLPEQGYGPRRPAGSSKPLVGVAAGVCTEGATSGAAGRTTGTTTTFTAAAAEAGVKDRHAAAAAAAAAAGGGEHGGRHQGGGPMSDMELLMQLRSSSSAAARKRRRSHCTGQGDPPSSSYTRTGTAAAAGSGGALQQGTGFQVSRLEVQLMQHHLQVLQQLQANRAQLLAALGQASSCSYSLGLGALWDPRPVEQQLQQLQESSRKGNDSGAAKAVNRVLVSLLLVSQAASALLHYGVRSSHAFLQHMLQQLPAVSSCCAPATKALAAAAETVERQGAGDHPKQGELRKALLAADTLAAVSVTGTV